MTEITVKRMLNDKEGAAYVGLGVTSFRAWSEQIGAVRKFGKRRLNDRMVIDQALDTKQDFRFSKEGSAT